jgi:hypothetical protein
VHDVTSRTSRQSSNRDRGTHSRVIAVVLSAYVKANSCPSQAAVVAHLLGSADAHRAGAALSDDLTLLVLRATPTV